MRKWFKIIIIVCSILLGLILAIVLLISPIAKSYIQKNDKELLGREITIDKFRLNILTGSLRIESLDIYEKDNKTKFISIDSFEINMKIYPLIFQKVVVQNIVFSEAIVNLTQNDTIFNFDDIINKFSSSDTTEPKDTSSSNWEITLNNISIEKSQIVYKDLQLNSIWALQNIALNIPSIYFSDKDSDIGLRFDFLNGGLLALNAKYNLQSSRYLLKINLENFALNSILPYLQQTMNVSEVSGLLSTQLNISGDAKHVMDFILKGSISAKDFSLKDNKQRNIISINNVTTQISELSLTNSKYRIDKLLVSGLSSQFDMYKDSTNNFTYLMKPDNSKASTTSDTNNKTNQKIDFLLKELIVESSSLKFNDLTLKRPFIYPISNINIISKNLSLNKENSLLLKANIGKGGKLILNWKGFMDNIANHDLTLIIQNLNLQEISPYCIELFGRPLSKGNLSFISQNIITNFNLKGTNNLEVYKCEVGDKDNTIDAEYGKIPLKLGLYVLKDINDKIKLDLPVKGNVNSPKFSYKKLIFKTLGNLLVKVALSPINLAAKQLGIKQDELSTIAIEPTQNIFTPEQFEKFNSLASISKSKPELILSLTQEANYENCIKEFSILDLKLEYFKSKNPFKEETRLDLVELDGVKNLNLKDNAFILYTDSLLIQKGQPTEGNIEEKAVRLFKEKAEQDLQNSMQNRNEKLIEYFTVELGVERTKLKITNLPFDEIKTNSKKTHYKISLGVEGDEVEENPDIK